MPFWDKKKREPSEQGEETSTGRNWFWSRCEVCGRRYKVYMEQWDDEDDLPPINRALCDHIRLIYKRLI